MVGESYSRFDNVYTQFIQHGRKNNIYSSSASIEETKIKELTVYEALEASYNKFDKGEKITELLITLAFYKYCQEEAPSLIPSYGITLVSVKKSKKANWSYQLYLNGIRMLSRPTDDIKITEKEIYTPVHLIITDPNPPEIKVFTLFSEKKLDNLLNECHYLNLGEV